MAVIDSKQAAVFVACINNFFEPQILDVRRFFKNLPLLCVEKNRDTVLVVVSYTAFVGVYSEALHSSELFKDDFGLFKFRKTSGFACDHVGVGSVVAPLSHRPRRDPWGAILGVSRLGANLCSWVAYGC